MRRIMHAPPRRLDVELVRLPGHPPEVKDPCVVRLPRGGWVMYASVGRTVDQRWLLGRFVASGLGGPWTEIAAPELRGLDGPRVCAPAVLAEDDGTWTMYVQTDCFTAGAEIATLRSDDGVVFTVVGTAVAPGPHALVYDAGCRRVTHRGHRLRVLLYTACDRVGSGDLWGIALDEDRPEDGWSPPRLVLAEEDVPFHNRRHDPHREWALEGAEVVQADAGLFLLCGVCFLALGPGTCGTRQRVFLAAAREPFGPYTPMGCPIEPTVGENGHPSAIIDDDELHLFHQRRDGDAPHWPWHLQEAVQPMPSVRRAMLAALDLAGA